MGGGGGAARLFFCSFFPVQQATSEIGHCVKQFFLVGNYDTYLLFTTSGVGI